MPLISVDCPLSGLSSKLRWGHFRVRDSILSKMRLCYGGLLYFLGESDRPFSCSRSSFIGLGGSKWRLLILASLVLHVFHLLKELVPRSHADTHRGLTIVQRIPLWVKGQLELGRVCNANLSRAVSPWAQIHRIVYFIGFVLVRKLWDTEPLLEHNEVLGPVHLLLLKMASACWKFVR